MKEILLRLLEELEPIGEQHEELFDTEVRNAMGRAVYRGFLKPEGKQLPATFLDSEEANRQVVEALNRYIAAANERAGQLGLIGFKSRLAAFQDAGVMTKDRNTYDDFFGYFNPARYDDNGRLVD